MFGLTTLFIVLALSSLFFWGNLRESHFWERHVSADGAVLDTRVVINRIVEGTVRGSVDYRLEARVKFRAEGQDQDLWVIVPEIVHDKIGLTAIARNHPKTCLVYWSPGHSDNAKCSFR